MTGRELISKILECADIDKDVEVSVDVSTGDEDALNRVFTDDFFEINDTSADAQSIMLLFSGQPNF